MLHISKHLVDQTLNVHANVGLPWIHVVFLFCSDSLTSVSFFFLLSFDPILSHLPRPPPYSNASTGKEHECLSHV